MICNSVRQKTKYVLKAELQNKVMLTVLFGACIITGLLSSISTFSASNLNHTAHANSAYSDFSSLVPEKLSLQLEHIDVYLEHMIQDRHPGWIAGYAKSVP